MIVIPDTNIFLHFRSIMEIPICDIFAISDVQVIVPSVVIQELDEHKWNHPKQGIRERAKESLVRIRDWTEITTDKNKPRFAFAIASKPASSLFNELNLDQRSNDDNILATVIELGRVHGLGNVVLLTNDIGPQLRARNFGIRVITLPDDYQLSSVPDVTQKEILRLERELATLKSRAPELIFLFSDESHTATATLPQQQNLDEISIEIYIQSILDKFRNYTSPSLPSANNSSTFPKEVQQLLGTISTFGQVPPEEMVRFTKDIEQFPAIYKTYAVQILAIENRIRRSIRLQFILQNNGTAIAEDIILALHLPDKLYWLNSIGDNDIPKPPLDPLPPRTLMQLSISSISRFPPTSMTQPSASNLLQKTNNRIIGPIINGKKAEWQIENLHHKSYWPLGQIFAVFHSSDNISNFGNYYSIRERHTPDIIQGNLLVQVIRNPE